jgi:hypothetical protein
MPAQRGISHDSMVNALPYAGIFFKKIQFIYNQLPDSN